MNYAGHEKLRADVAEVANTMCRPACQAERYGASLSL